MRELGKRQSRSFSFAKYGGDEAAQQAARQWQRQESDRLGQTVVTYVDFRPEQLHANDKVRSGGSIRFRGTWWQVRMNDAARSYCRSFPVSVYGNRDAAERAARSWQRQESDRLGHTSALSKVERGIVISDDYRQWLAGFLDGDGSVGVYHFHGTNREQERCRVSFAQSCEAHVPPVLLNIQKSYGGSISVHAWGRVSPTTDNEDTVDEPSDMDHHASSSTQSQEGCDDRGNDSGFRTYPRRREWQLDLRKWHTILQFLEHIEPFTVIKHQQIVLMLTHMREHAEKECDCEQRLKEMKEFDRYSAVHIDRSRITDAWIAGLADAEGCVLISTGNSISVGIAQSSCIRVLDAINEKFGGVGGGAAHGVIRFHGANAQHVLERIRPHARAKHEQIDCALEFRDIQEPRDGYKSPRMLLRMEELRSRITALKKV